eukprot:6066553-Amphidinium_carterae.1
MSESQPQELTLEGWNVKNGSETFAPTMAEGVPRQLSESGDCSAVFDTSATGPAILSNHLARRFPRGSRHRTRKRRMSACSPTYSAV